MTCSELQEAAEKAKTINLKTEWWTPQELITLGISRTSAYFIAAASPDAILALLAKYDYVRGELAKADKEEDRLLATANDVAEEKR
jgi:hypothetical protein